MRMPRIRFTLRRAMVAVAAVALLLATARVVLSYLGPRDGNYTGVYRYLGPDWKWHVVRGTSILVHKGMIITD